MTATVSVPPPLAQPPPLNPESDETTWRKWRRLFEAYSRVAGIHAKDPEDQIAALITCIGFEALDIYEALPFTKEADRKDLTKTLDLLQDHFAGQQNLIYNRWLFNTRDQEEGEPFQAYLLELRRLARGCKLEKVPQEEILRDRIVCGIRDKGLKQSLLMKKDLSLDACIDTCRGAEKSKAQSQHMSSAATAGAASKGHHSGADPDPSLHATTFRSHVGAGPWDRRQTHRHEAAGVSGLSRKSCMYCGRDHARGACPAYGRECTNCGRRNHFAGVCRQRASGGRGAKPLRHVDDTYDIGGDTREVHTDASWPFMPITVIHDDVEASAEADTATASGADQPPCVNWTGSRQPDAAPAQIFTELEVEGRKVKFQLDTGASCNVIGKKDLPSNITLRPTSKVLRLYDTSSLRPAGTLQATITNPRTGQHFEAELIVVDSPRAIPLLGARSCIEMNLLTIQRQNIHHAVANPGQGPHTRAEFVTAFADLFDGGLGLFKGSAAHLDVNPNVTPVKLPLRRVPLAVKDDLLKELQRLESMGVIKREDHPTEWVSSMVVARKSNGALRVCIDPKPLNKAIQRRCYPMPVMDDIVPRLTKARVFSICDVASGYWHVPLDEESSRLTTFATPAGQFRWLRLPFGISAAPELFQMRLDQAIAGLRGVATIVDDMLIWGEGATDAEAEEDHDRNLLSLMIRCRQAGIKMCPRKFRFRQKRVAYVGHQLSARGLESDPTKVSAITNMESPKSTAELQRFLGMVNYLAKFLPRISETCAPLRELLQHQNEWCWTATHEDAVQQIKKAVSATPVLRFFDPTKPVTTQCDASSIGLGAALMQEGQPVAFASRALTSTEAGYAHIEKELLAIMFALERFDHYVYGRPVQVESDHKPLQPITSKPLLCAPRRLQRMLLRMQRYDYCIQYRPGKELLIADTLSRAPVQLSEEDTACANDFADVAMVSDNDLEIEHVNATEELPIPGPQVARLRAETERDEVLQSLAAVIQAGWPTEVLDVTPCLRPYFHFRDELTVDHGIIFRGSRCVIPAALRTEILQNIHSGHLGIGACIRRARESVFWPGITAQVRDCVSKCATCQSLPQRQPPETLVTTQHDARPWSTVGADLFSFAGLNYLAVVDYHSNFLEIDHLTDTTSRTVILILKRQFARHGIPDTLRTDNGPQFASAVFRNFATEWQFHHITSSPRYAQSNGKVENAIKTAKRIMAKAQMGGADPWLAILAFRNAPTQGLESSPAQRLMGRRTRTTLPMHRDLLRQNASKEEDMTSLRHQQAKGYDRSARDLPPLRIDDVVRVEPAGRHEPWRKAQVVKVHDNRSYDVQTLDGTVLRRNRRHLRKTAETFESQSSVFYDNEPQPGTISRQQHPEQYRTRSGRISKPPQRYGW